MVRSILGAVSGGNADASEAYIVGGSAGVYSSSTVVLLLPNHRPPL
jgi:hypothetical protein